MASALRKLADKLEGKDKEHDNPQSSNFGPHSSAAANKVDPFVDSDRDGRNDPTSRVGGYGNTQQTTTTSHVAPGTHTTGLGSQPPTNYGPHDSNLANKVDPRVDSTQPSHLGGYDTSHTTTGHHQQSTNAGPHSSNLANKLDPRVDSDLDNRNDPTSRVGGYGNTQHTTGAGYGNTQHTTGAGYGNTHAAGNTLDNPHSTNAGPHSSNVMNKLDPRVDSDVDGRNNPTSHVGGYGNSQTTTTTGVGYGNTHAGGNPHSTNVGPHSSNLLNKLDPRVDSDVDGRNDPTSHVGGYGNTQTSTHQPPLGTHTGAGAGGYTGTNTAHNDPRSTNTGPHSSNLLNKLDPRVDSDRDGRDDPTSRTGGYGQTQTGGTGIGRY